MDVPDRLLGGLTSRRDEVHALRFDYSLKSLSDPQGARGEVGREVGVETPVVLDVLDRDDERVASRRRVEREEGHPGRRSADHPRRGVFAEHDGAERAVVHASDSPTPRLPRRPDHFPDAQRFRAREYDAGDPYADVVVVGITEQGTPDPGVIRTRTSSRPVAPTFAANVEVEPSSFEAVHEPVGESPEPPRPFETSPNS